MYPDSQTYVTGELIKDGKLAIGDGYRAKNIELAGVGIPFARAGNIDNGFLFDGADRFPEEDLAKVGEKISRPGDVVFTSKGTVGRFAFVREETPRFVFSPQLCYWRSLDTDFIDPHYLYYWMNGREFWAQASAVKGETDMADYVSLTDQRRMKLTLPPISVQREIRNILGVLDDKIELNRQMNHTLEAMAQAIFKSWFVDFDPVTAKAEGRQPYGMNTETAALFPSHFVESELGPIPEGWDISEIGKETRVCGGGTPRTNRVEFWEDGKHCFVTPKDMATLPAKVLLGSERHITELGVNAISSKQLPSGTVLLSSRAPIGYLALAGVPVSVNQGMIAMVCDNRLSKYYVLHWTQCNMNEIEARAGGTTFAEISKKNFRPIPCLLPPKELLSAFDGIAGPIYSKIESNLQESSTLASIRDTLLPKLLSGEIRVKDAGKQAEAVA